jgi:hypothetical protein
MFRQPRGRAREAGPAPPLAGALMYDDQQTCFAGLISFLNGLG